MIPRVAAVRGIDLDGLPVHIVELLLHDMAPLTEDDARRIVAALDRAVRREGGCVYVHCSAG